MQSDRFIQTRGGRGSKHVPECTDYMRANNIVPQEVSQEIKALFVILFKWIHIVY